MEETIEDDHKFRDLKIVFAFSLKTAIKYNCENEKKLQFVITFVVFSRDSHSFRYPKTISQPDSMHKLLCLEKYIHFLGPKQMVLFFFFINFVFQNVQTKRSIQKYGA